MSLASKVTFGLCCTVSLGVIGYVHWKQHDDRQQLHLGVVRDIERQERRKAQNLYLLEQQKALTQQLKQQQLHNADNQENDTELRVIPSATPA